MYHLLLSAFLAAFWLLQNVTYYIKSFILKECYEFLLFIRTSLLHLAFSAFSNGIELSWSVITQVSEGKDDYLV